VGRRHLHQPGGCYGAQSAGGADRADLSRRAEQVLIWLGEGTPDSDLAVEFLVPFKEILEVSGIERADFVEGRNGVLRGRFSFSFISAIGLSYFGFLLYPFVCFV
jgi:hypothetical protein